MLCDSPGLIQQRSLERSQSQLRLKRLNNKRRKLARKLRLYNPEVDAPVALRDIDLDIERHRGVLSQLPCSGCAGDELCGQSGRNAFSRLVDEAAWIDEALCAARDALWLEFRRHCDFLILNGFANPDGALTEDGRWAAKLRLDQPLIIAELIRNGMLEKLTPELLCAVLAVFVNDKFRDLDLDDQVHWDRRELRGCYFTMKDRIADILEKKKQHGFSVPTLQFWPAAALYLWSMQRSWEDVQQLTGADEGDLAMLIFRTADNLRQLVSLEDTHPALAARAAACIKLLLREPVVIPL